MPQLRIRQDDLRDPRIEAFMNEHLADMHATSPPESVHALDMAKLRRPEISFFTGWYDTPQGDELVVTGALKRLDMTRGELKSMRSRADLRGHGLGRQMLLHLMDYARSIGLQQLLLETGTGPFFEPAHGLYLSQGFVDCGPFDDYTLDPFSRYMHRLL